MITDFPEVKKELLKATNAFLKQKFKANAPMFSMGRKKTLHEGDKMGVLYEDGSHVVNDLQHAQSGFSISQKDIPTMKPDDLLNMIAGMAEDLAGQMERGLLKRLDEAIEKSGNIIPGNIELGYEFILKGLEKIKIDFEDDERAKPIKPSIFAGPDAIQKFKEQIEKSTQDEIEAYRQREDAILDKKYAEHLKDLESRKIVD